LIRPLSEPEPRVAFLSAFPSLFPSESGSEPALDKVLRQARYRELSQGEALIREGESCLSVPFVTSGVIRVFKRAESGREITLYRVERGQSCILSSGCGASLSRFPASAVAETDLAAAFFPPELVRSLLDSSAPFRDFAFSQYATRLAETMELVQEIAFRRVDERLAQELKEAASFDGALSTGSAPATGREIASTHQELADHLGTSREVVSRILKDWEERGFLELGRGAIRLRPSFSSLLED
jgi:CRP/FNR family transcriptional regulator, anaerobic regulatory protein